MRWQDTSSKRGQHEQGSRHMSVAVASFPEVSAHAAIAAVLGLFGTQGQLPLQAEVYGCTSEPCVESADYAARAKHGRLLHGVRSTLHYFWV